MVLKNFVFIKSWVGSEVAGMKLDFFLPFPTQPGPTFQPQKAQRRNFLNITLIFNPLERQKLLPNIYVT